MMNIKTGFLMWLCRLWIMAWVFTGCFPGPRELPDESVFLTKLQPAQYPDFTDTLEMPGLLDAVDESLLYFGKVPLDRQYTYADDTYTAAHMIKTLEFFQQVIKNPDPETDINALIRSHFQVYESTGNTDGQVVFTGYYEPVYPGCLTQSDTCPYPIYGLPDDLFSINLSDFSRTYAGHRRLMARVDSEKKQVMPYYSRQQINAVPDFHLRATPVAWLESRIDRFFLEIQGSGQVVLDTGEHLRIHYLGTNGNAYTSIGRYLIDQGEIAKEEMSMQAIRQWLERNPDRMDEVLHQNDSVVFFKAGQDGPYGSLGVQVTPFRSIATDPAVFPRGGLCFVRTRLPDRYRINPLKVWEDTAFFAMNQDAGGAIKGPARADIFCGTGNYAEFTAGHMNTPGQLFFLVLKQRP